MRTTGPVGASVLDVQGFLGAHAWARFHYWSARCNRQPRSDKLVRPTAPTGLQGWDRENGDGGYDKQSSVAKRSTTLITGRK